MRETIRIGLPCGWFLYAVRAGLWYNGRREAGSSLLKQIWGIKLKEEYFQLLNLSLLKQTWGIKNEETEKDG